MALLGRRLRRRQILQAGAAAAGALILPGRAPAQGGSKPLSGITLNIACWSSPYAKLLTDYIPQFEEETGANVNYETPSFMCTAFIVSANSSKVLGIGLRAFSNKS